MRGDAPADRLFVATIDGVWQLDRLQDDSWRVAHQGLPGVHVGSLLLDRTCGGLFAGAHSGGFFASFDHGLSWERRMHGLTQAHVFCLASRESDGRTTLYAGTEPAHLYRSTDSGEHWHEIEAIRAVPGVEKWLFPAPPHLPHVKQVVFHPAEDGTILVCVEQGALLRTRDGGANWMELGSFHDPSRHRYYKDVHRVRFSPANPGLIYMTGGDGLFRSVDDGERWTQLTDGSMRIGYPDDIHLHPRDDRILFMAGAGTDPSTWPERGTADAGIMCSEDAAGTWRQLRSGLPQSLRGHVSALTMHAYGAGLDLFAATSDGQVFRGRDDGTRWTLIADGLPAIAKGNHHQRLPRTRT